MLRIRYKRIGRRNQPSFRVVVTDKKRPPRGGDNEEIGFYNPLTKERRVDADRARYWLERGAQPSARVRNLLIAEGVITGNKRPVHGEAPESHEGGDSAGEGEEPTK